MRRIVKTLHPSIIDKSKPLAQGIVGAWFANEGTGARAHDLSGYDNHGDFGAGAAAPSWAAGRFGKAIYFDGNDYITVPHHSSFVMGSTVTVALWIKINIFAINTFLIGKSAGNIGFSLRIDSINFNDLEFYIGDGGAYHFFTKTHGMVIGNWYFVAATYNAIRGELFVNGNSIGFVNDAFVPNWGNLNLYFASNAIGVSNLDCYIDNIVIYNRALSAAEVRDLYFDPLCLLKTKRLFRYVA